MKTLKRLNNSLLPVSTRALLLLAMAFAAAFLFLTSREGFAGSNNCVVCHKRTQTLTLPCNSLEYRRHIDHGDPMTACAATSVLKEEQAVNKK